jgi:hypothetical protein
LPKPIESTPTTMAELLQSVSVAVSVSSTYKRFQRMYHSDRIAFVHDILPDMWDTIAPYQVEILGYFDDGKKRVAVRGPHGLGKTFLASILVHHSILTAEDDAKTITTASAWRQLEKYLWPEIKKTAKCIQWHNVGRDQYTREEFLQLAIRLNGGTVEAFAIACDDSETIEGAHAKYLTYIFDEAKAIPRNTWDSAEGAFSNANIRIGEDRNIVYDDVVDAPIYTNNSPKELDMGESNTHKIIGNNSKTLDGGNIQDMEYGIEYGDMDSTEQLDSNAISDMDSNKQLEINKKIGISTKIVPTISNSPSQYRTSHTNYKQLYTSNASTYEALAFAISTPGEASGQFYDIHMHKPGYEDWYTRHVTIQEAISAKRISNDWVQQRALQWGIDSAIYLNRVLGEFADISDEGIIPLSWIRKAIERFIVWKNNGAKLPDYGNCVLGCDIARRGEDKTVLAEKHAWLIKNFHEYSKLSTTQCSGHIEHIANPLDAYIHIEINGIGAGVYDIMKDDGTARLRPIDVSAGTTFRDKSKSLRFANVRSAMWWNVRELLDPGNKDWVIERYGSEIALPPNDKMILDLSTPHWDMKREATVSLESKESIMERLGRSPDWGTAVCLALWQPHTGGGVVF